MEFPNEIWNWMSGYPTLKERPDWEAYFLMFAFITSRRSSCFRHKVGAVIVKNKDVIATGYNGSPTYQPNCLRIGSCYRNKNNIESNTQLELCRASGSHAESNAIVFAAKNGHSVLGAELYIYGHYAICNMCRGLIANSGISRVIHLDEKGIVHSFNTENWVRSPVDPNPLLRLIKKE